MNMAEPLAIVGEHEQLQPSMMPDQWPQWAAPTELSDKKERVLALSALTQFCDHGHI